MTPSSALRVVVLAIALVGLAGCASYDWRQAQNSNSVDGYEHFLHEHSDDAGAFSAIEAVESIYLKRDNRNEALKMLEDWHRERIKSGALAGRLVIADVRPKMTYTFAAGTFTYTKESDGTTAVATEFPHDSMGFALGSLGFRTTQKMTRLPEGSSLHGAVGSLQRYAGRYRVDSDPIVAIVGNGDQYHRLTFAPVQGTGYVYVRGKGRAILADSREIPLSVDPASFAAVQALEKGTAPVPAWPPPELAKAPQNPPEIKRVDDLSVDPTIRDPIFTSASKQRKLVNGMWEARAKYHWSTTGEVRWKSKLEDVDGPETCVGGAFMIFAGREGFWTGIHYRKPAETTMVA